MTRRAAAFGQNGTRAGETHYKARLSDDQVREIRARYVPGRGGGVYRLAREFDCAPQTIHNIVTYHTRWSAT